MTSRALTAQRGDVKGLTEDILTACQKGDWFLTLETLRLGNANLQFSKLLKSNSIVNSEGLTPLHLAAKGGHEKILIELLNYGVSSKHIDGKGNTSLHIAAKVFISR